jgi:hypothetical protein
VPTPRDVLDRYFDALRTRDRQALAACLAPNVRRTGPYLDVVEGREPYADFLAHTLAKLANYQLWVDRVMEFDDRTSLVLLREVLDVEGVPTAFPEALLFGFDETGLIASVDVYIKQPPRAR